ncbi:MAG TPA: hypothetical protein VIF62_40150 [Labilithrix sp.]
MADARHKRQMRLAEIGERGQARLEAAEVCVGGDVARAYLRLAGVKVVENGEPVSADVSSLGLRHAEARAVGEGALLALVAMRGILEVG